MDRNSELSFRVNSESLVLKTYPAKGRGSTGVRPVYFRGLDLISQSRHSDRLSNRPL